ncbi:ApeA N-terminal domain 1-containing protein [Nocardia gipuzkoensis]
MVNQRLRDMMSGSLAHLWPQFDLSKIDRDPEPGYLRAQDDGIYVSILENSSFEVFEKMRTEKTPSSIVAATEQGGALFTDIHPIRRSFVIGEAKASTSVYRSRLAVVGFSVDWLNSSSFRSMTLYIPGVSEWAGVQGYAQSFEKGPDKRFTSWTTTVKSAPPQSAALGRARNIELSTHWEVTGPQDRRIVYVPAKFTVTSTTPVDWRQCLSPLLHIQDLVNLAFKGYVAADGGEAVLDTSKSTDTASGAMSLWSQRAMVAPEGVKPPRSMNERPTYYLQDLGGIAGVRRWIALNESYPRAAGPLVYRYRRGAVNVETQLTNVAIAIEYWVNLHGRTTKWAAYKPLKLNHAERLARYIGKDFEKFVGDTKKWANKFWTLYGDLKHNHKASYDPYEAHVLAESGLILLECALLNRVSRNKKPSKRICSSHRNVNIGDSVRELFI